MNLVLNELRKTKMKNNYSPTLFTTKMFYNACYSFKCY